MKACFQIAECSLFYLKTVPVSAMKACFQIAECSLFYLKTVPVSAMKACFQIAECSLFYLKTVNAKPRFHVFRTVFPVVRRCHAKKRGDNLL
ncbi:biotin synthase [Leyella lascolaii]|uniref:biotin synthase n=1 Tax=Leyella lascolaii TaxID=1776379 RepID=UPI001F144F61|nr:biotin synthase [Leyella lascolaii]